MHSLNFQMPFAELSLSLFDAKPPRGERDLDKRAVPLWLWGELHQLESWGPPACAHGHS